jgi:hypothetical protein
MSGTTRPQTRWEALEKPWNTAPTALVNGLERSPSFRLVWSLVCPEALEKARY